MTLILQKCPGLLWYEVRMQIARRRCDLESTMPSRYFAVLALNHQTPRDVKQYDECKEDEASTIAPKCSFVICWIRSLLISVPLGALFYIGRTTNESGWQHACLTHCESWKYAHGTASGGILVRCTRMLFWSLFVGRSLGTSILVHGIHQTIPWAEINNQRAAWF